MRGTLSPRQIDFAVCRVYSGQKLVEKLNLSTSGHTHAIADVTGLQDALDALEGGGGGGGGTWTEVEIDFGSGTPKFDAQFTVTDAEVSGTSKIIVMESGKAATGRVSGDAQWDQLQLSAEPGTGNFTLYVLAIPGPVVGKRKIQYQVA